MMPASSAGPTLLLNLITYSGFRVGYALVSASEGTTAASVSWYRRQPEASSLRADGPRILAMLRGSCGDDARSVQLFTCMAQFRGLLTR